MGKIAHEADSKPAEPLARFQCASGRARGGTELNYSGTARETEIGCHGESWHRTDRQRSGARIQPGKVAHEGEGKAQASVRSEDVSKQDTGCKEKSGP